MFVISLRHNTVNITNKKYILKNIHLVFFPILTEII